MNLVARRIATALLVVFVGAMVVAVWFAGSQNVRGGSMVATDTIKVPARCQALAIWVMHGYQEVRLNAYEARRVEEQLEGCGATVVKRN